MLTPEPPDLRTKGIVQFFHCGLCIQEKPDDLSPREWSRNEVGWTAQGLQVWCMRHDCNVIHIDFEGRRLRGTDRRLPPDGAPC